MFERFTDRARRVVVRSQEEARDLKHNYIGTEHILLGLLSEGQGVAAMALERFEMSPESVRKEVIASIGLGTQAPAGHIPFTPRAKKVLELALREALQLNHDYIGTEHILLGVLREGEGVGAQILKKHTVDLTMMRTTVLTMLQGYRAKRGGEQLRFRLRATAPGTGPDEPIEPPTTPAGIASLVEAARLAREQPVGSHHLMLAALSDPDAAAARALSALGVDLDQARVALRGIDVTGTSDELPEEAGRRQMLIRVADDKITIEASDPVIIHLGQAALEALGDQANPPGTIRGELAASASLSALWLVLRSNLDDIRQRAESPAVVEEANTEAAEPVPEQVRPRSAEPGSEPASPRSAEPGSEPARPDSAEPGSEVA
jgi:ATP-dependent Clp protease ATP-binding subunit ClpA